MPWSLLMLAGWMSAPPPPSPAGVSMNRAWDLLEAPASDPQRRAVLRRAGRMMGDWRIDLGETNIDGAVLTELADEHPQEPLLRVVREILRRPVDLDDFLRFIDDLLVAGTRGLRGRPVSIPPSRARSAGIFVHPNDLFRPKKARRYGSEGGVLSVDPAPSQDGLQPAKDGDVVGPRWAARYQQPDTSEARLLDLGKKNPGFARRARALVTQLRDQGAYVQVEAAIRKRERGYLIYGAYWLSRAKIETRWTHAFEP